MEAKFRVEDLKRKIDELIEDGIELVEVAFYERDEMEGEIIGATLEFFAYDQDGEELDYGGIEEAEIVE